MSETSSDIKMLYHIISANIKNAIKEIKSYYNVKDMSKNLSDNLSILSPEVKSQIINIHELAQKNYNEKFYDDFPETIE